jgi:hypothetical protein
MKADRLLQTKINSLVYEEKYGPIANKYIRMQEYVLAAMQIL